MSVKVSVIVPIYNVEKFLPCCLDSLVKQTLKEIEIICVDDGSTDGTANILKDYAARFSNIKIVSIARVSIGQARNTGVDNAVGDYIAYVDADDFVKPEFCERLYETAIRYDTDIVVTNFYIYRNESAETFAYRDMKLMHRLNAAGVFSAAEQPEVLINFGCWDKLYKHSFLKENNILFPENRIYEDFKYSYDALIRAKRICAINDRLYFYRKNAGKSITDQEKKNDLFKFDFLKNFAEIEEEWKTKPDFEKYFRPTVMFLLVRDGYFHNSNIRNKRVFKEFFTTLSTLITDSDIDKISALKDEEYLPYLGYLKSGNWKKCYFMFKKL